MLYLEPNYTAFQENHLQTITGKVLFRLYINYWLSVKK